jgi:hypothetical protein
MFPSVGFKKYVIKTGSNDNYLLLAHALQKPLAISLQAICQGDKTT